MNAESIQKSFKFLISQPHMLNLSQIYILINVFQFRPFLNTSIKTVAYLTHHLACHYWSKFQTKLTTFGGVLAKNPPK